MEKWGKKDPSGGVTTTGLPTQISPPLGSIHRSRRSQESLWRCESTFKRKWDTRWVKFELASRRLFGRASFIRSKSSLSKFRPWSFENVLHFGGCMKAKPSSWLIAWWGMGSKEILLLRASQQRVESLTRTSGKNRIFFLSLYIHVFLYLFSYHKGIN